MDRALDFGSSGCGFESCLVRFTFSSSVASFAQAAAVRALRHSNPAKVNSASVTTNKAPTINHSSDPLLLSGSMPKTSSIQSLHTTVITNKIPVIVAMPASSQKSGRNVFLISSTPRFDITAQVYWEVACLSTYRWARGVRQNGKGEFQHILAKKITIYSRENYCPGPLGRPAVTGGAVASWRDRAGEPGRGDLVPSALLIPITNPHYECRMGARKRLARKR